MQAIIVVENASDQSWSRHQMETFSALLAICAGNSPVSGEFPTQRPVTQSFDVCFDPRLNKPFISKHQSSASLAFVLGIVSGDFPAQMASKAENVSIW